MSYPSVPILTTGELVEASDWNAIFADLASHLGTFQFLIDGAALRPDLTDGCDYELDQTLTAGRALLSGVGFSGTADQFAQFKIALPKAWNAGTLTFRVRYGGTAAGSGDVMFSLAASASSDGEAIDQAFGTAITVTDTFLGTSKTHATALSAAMTIGNTPIKQDQIYFRFGRLATNGADTKVEKIWVEAVELFLVTDAVTDA